MSQSTRLRRSRHAAFIKQGGRCYYCSLPMLPSNDQQDQVEVNASLHLSTLLRCTAEHLRPRSEGGPDTPDNIVAAHAECNERRHRMEKALQPDRYRKLVQNQIVNNCWHSQKALSLLSRLRI
ncbi:HNH endonuclease [Ottowia thiooxydans]|uniref:HNH endonuclease n=1 Tax=Ottowia thiooxydans TaxID=219182 RepID=UPI003393AD71